MAALRQEPPIENQALWMSAFRLILLQKPFWSGERKFLEPLMRFARGDARGTISFHLKSITNLRSGLECDAAAEKP